VVGIVIVAHSTWLAESLLEQTNQVLREKVPLAAAGGIEDPEHPFGTDALRIHQAIESVYSSDGVVVLMDMGSALLSAELSLEFLAEEKRARIRLCEAPLVEGTIAAAVRSEGGGSLDQVVEEARGALAAKTSQLQSDLTEKAKKSPHEAGEQVPAREMRLHVKNRLGIHARPAARFVSTASQFQSEITVRNISRNTKAVSARSINLVATLSILQGHEIAITAAGHDAEEALAALTALVENGFGEAVKAGGVSPEELAVEKGAFNKPRQGESILSGIPVSPGIAIGPAVFYKPSISGVPDVQVKDPRAEWQRLQTAVQTVRKTIQTVRTRMSVQAGDYEAAIFDAHLLSLEDPVLIETAHRKIFEQPLSAEKAWQMVIDEIIASYKAAESPYVRVRAADLADLKTQVLRILTGSTMISFKLHEPSIVIANDLHPSDLARLDPDLVSGICTALGSATSHSAILAVALGIPAVVGAGPEVLRLAEGTLLALDGKEGRVWVNPAAIEAFRKRRREWMSAQKSSERAGRRQAVTLDGHRIKIAANISSPLEVRCALSLGAEGIGILRTEFLFLNRITAPSEEEQAAVYRSIADQLGTRPCIIRTLDVGGDKQLPYLDLQAEANPFLGQRGIRLCLDHPDLLRTQLRAILRASPDLRLKIILPMISSIKEVQHAKQHLHEAQADLKREGIPFDASIEVGIMVEIPSAALIADQLAQESNFFSIGTNDLCQYTMAADRTNAQIAHLRDALHPAVLRLIRRTVRAGHDAGIRVGLCGEAAGDPLAVPIFLGMGIDELSMSPPIIPSVKHRITCFTKVEAESIADEVLHLGSAEEVREYVKKRLHTN